LIGANFNGANLSLANLSGANLSGTELVNADLSGATLTNANLGLSNLSNAELTGVRWQLRAMRGCYLGVRGLDSCFGNALRFRKNRPRPLPSPGCPPEPSSSTVRPD
jgi:uncharacterized protein YjbI with pentapeptide repeats